MGSTSSAWPPTSRNDYAVSPDHAPKHPHSHNSRAQAMTNTYPTVRFGRNLERYPNWKGVFKTLHGMRSSLPLRTRAKLAIAGCHPTAEFAKLGKAGLLSTVSPEIVQEARAYQLRTVGRPLDPTMNIAMSNFTDASFPQGLSHSFYSEELQFFLNDRTFIDAYSDKTIYHTLLPKAAHPVTIIARSFGNYFGPSDAPISQLRAERHLLDAENDMIVKPARAGNGEGVALLKSTDGQLLLDGQPTSISALVTTYGDHFIVQEKLAQHETLERLNPTSLNTFRVTTLRWKGRIFALPSFLRIGGGGAVFDNASAGGLCLGVNPDGGPASYALSYDLRKVHNHPDTGVSLTSTNFGSVFPDARRLCVELHQSVRHHNLISWDIGISPTGQPIFIEFNFRGAFWIYQMATGRPVLGELQDEVLSELGRRQH